MKKSMLVLLLPCAFLLCGCQDTITVHVANDTMDNIRINNSDKHMEPGKKATLRGFLRIQDGETYTFQICRSYGCPATVLVVPHFWPEEDVFRIEFATLTITESPRNTFFISSDSSYVSADIFSILEQDISIDAGYLYK